MFFLYVLTLLLFFAALCLAVVINIHMFQLNSYKPKTHTKWIFNNLRRNWSHLLALVIAFVVLLNTIVGLVLINIAFIIFLSKNNNVQAKKPLVYTARVKRLLACIFVLVVVSSVAMFRMPVSYGYFFICIFYALIPFIVLLANYINMPIEASIRKYYINDAKKILKSCPDLIIIGITGSYGKTSVKYYLTTLLKAKYNVLMTPESYNTPMGVVKTIREQLNATHEIFVCEMGARFRGDIKELCDLVKPKHGILTAIGNQHLDTQKTIENIIKTKFELSDAIPEDGLILFNGDNEHIRKNLPNKKYMTYGLGNNNDFFAKDIAVTQNGTSFLAAKLLAESGEETYESKISVSDVFQTQLIGEHNVVNLIGAIAMCDYLGVPLDDLRMQIKKITSVPHRLELTKTNGIIIIDDSYNSNPFGCKVALKTLAVFEGYKILITPGMVELGDEEDISNFNFGKDAGQVCDFVILVGEKQTEHIYKGLMESNFNKDNIFIANGVKEGFEKAYSIKTEKQKVLLIENDLPDNY